MSQPKLRTGRRNFLKGAAVGAASFVAAPIVMAQQNPSAAPTVEVTGNEKPGSDFMVDVLKSLDIEYCAANPGSSFRGLHESFINYGGNKTPEWLTCCHEEVAVNIANGYYAVAGKPMAILTFAPSGLHHATMGIYGAYSAHTPTYIICSDFLDAAERRPSIDWAGHAVLDPAQLVRDFIKWDDT